ncbi:MAG: hypothetical protein AAGI46_05540 [Planctomycetota bacterium]
MQKESLRQELKKEPFQQLDIKTSDGDTFRIVHPDFALITPTGSAVYIFDKDDHYRVVDLAHVVTVEPVKPPKKKVARK